MTMKLNKNKGKVHPSPSSSSSSSSSSSFSLSSISSSDPVSSLNLLLPAAILTLISVLSLQDLEVLAYMITRSLKSATNPALILEENNTHNRQSKSKSKKSHKSPTFDCGCFDCYTSYWFRWDSSPHRELIHQAIEAFEEHLSTTERTTQNHKSAKGSRRREKEKEKDKDKDKDKDKSHKAPEMDVNAIEERVELGPPQSPAIVQEEEEALPESVAEEDTTEKEERESEEEEEEKEKQLQREQQQQHKGLARKVLPDVIGLFNSRLWNLWGPNV